MAILQEFSNSDLPGIIALQNKLFPAYLCWKQEDAKAQLTDLARNRGRNVVKAVQGDILEGIAAWVSQPETREFYGVPFFVASIDAASLLANELIRRAQAEHAKFLRVSAYAYEKEKLQALKSGKFRRIFDFIDLAIEPSISIPTNKIDFKYIPADQVDGAKYKDIYNMSFKSVPNAPPVSQAQAVEEWNSPQLNNGLSGVWENESGDYIAFIVIHKNGYIDSIGVHPCCQRRGIGSLIYQNVFSKAGTLGIKKLHVTIADNNVGSLQLHRHTGFEEVDRRQVWQLDLR